MDVPYKDRQDPLTMLRKIFDSAPEEYGTLQEPTKKGLIRIAKEKFAAWNYWRKIHPLVYADFRNVNFTEAENYINDFSHFQFRASHENGPCVSFDGAIFCEQTRFNHAIFESNASFHDATFTGILEIENSEFGSGANFSKANFKQAAIFRNANFGRSANFSNSKFGISTLFEKVKFGDHANFMNANFGYNLKFKETNFGNSCCFFDCRFDEITEFNSCSFGDSSDFRKSEFKDQALFVNSNFANSSNFMETIFGDVLIFESCDFQNHTYFMDTKFGTSSRITDCNFGDHLSFHASEFGENIRIKINKCGEQPDFSHAHFLGKADLSESHFGKFSSFQNIVFTGHTSFERTTFHGDVDLSFSRHKNIPNSANKILPFAKYSTEEKSVIEATEAEAKEHSEFQEVIFSGTHFGGDAKFTDRKFKSTANFGPSEPKTIGDWKDVRPTKFFGIAEFHGCAFSQNTSFEQAFFFVEKNEKYALSFRTLKGLMRELDATQMEQHFFRLEIQAEQKHQSTGRKILYDIYRKTSFYGVSIARPICTLAIFTLLFAITHGFLADIHASTAAIGVDWERTWQWARYVIINAVPVPGFDKAQIELRDDLFGKGGIATFAMALEMLHKLIALGCAFLLGLALRNLFKMKS